MPHTHTQLLLRDQARTRLLAGATALAEALRITLGPRSKSVLIGRGWEGPLVCNDGVTIARQVSLADPVEDLGARMLRQAATRTGDAVGDGTTTSTLLAHAMYAEGLRNVVAGASAIDLKRGLDAGVRAGVEALARLSRPVAQRKETVQVATIAAHNDAAIGELVAEAMARVGADGTLSVEEAKGTETVLEVVEGLQFERGYLSPYFITDPARMEAVLEDVAVLLLERRISTVTDLIPLLEQAMKAGRALLIVAEDLDPEVLATLVVNKLRGTIACAAVKAPGYGERRKDELEDIATLCGGKALTEDLGLRLSNVALSDLGLVRRALITKENTTLIGGAGSKEAIAGRAAELRRRIEQAGSDYERETLQKRLAKLAGGVAVIRAGAHTEAEMKARKEALDDAISATKAAVAEGIVPGGGVALLRVADALRAQEPKFSGDELTGLRILERALEVPVRQIAENSGADAGVVLAELRAGAPALGYDAARGEYVDMLAAGIVDPTKVVRTALENAVSVAGVLLLAEGTLTEVEEPRAHAHARDGELED